MLEQIISALVAAGVRFVVLGGVAATIHGSARLTNDLDICYDTERDNLLALTQLLQSWGAYLRGVDPGLPFIVDERALRASPFMTLTTTLGDIDLLDRVPGIGVYADALSASEQVTIGTTEFRTLTLPALILAKRAAGRPKDLDHVLELQALQVLRESGR